MEISLFAMLTGISPWWWVALALALAIVEVLTFSFFLIWPALAAVAVAVLLWIFPDMSGSAQLLWFAILAAAFTVGGRQMVFMRKPTSERPNLNQRGSALIGRNAVIVDGFVAGGLGNVEVDGVRWRARMPDHDRNPAPGEIFGIADADGMMLILEEHPRG